MKDLSIHDDTFAFLRELRVNNDREWFNEHKPRYLAAQANFKNFIEAMIVRLSTFDPHINTDIDAGRCLFRIYRDIRFSKNKDPYKRWLAAGISIDGRKLDGPEYYIHIEPDGKSFIASGYWRPHKEHLAAIRQEIDYNADALTQALQDGKWTAADLSTEDTLIRPPAGYAADHPQIELLKLKSYILYVNLSDEQLMSSNALDTVIDACRRFYPFKAFLHEAIG